MISMEYQIDEFNIRPFSSLKRKKSRIYVFPKGETIWENIQNRRVRPVDIYRGIVCDALQVNGIHVSTVRLSWNQKAGCSCGCSPGFVVEQDSTHSLIAQDVYVTFSEKKA